MSLLSWAATAAIGRMLIFVWQRFPEKYVPTEFLKDVHNCDLCSGTYLYPVLFWLAGVDILDSIVFGISTSFVVWVFVRGMKTVIEPQTLIIK